MSHLLDLPNELLVHIGSQLSQKRNERDLKNVVLVCARLRSSLQPLLYDKVGWIWEEEFPTAKTRVHLLLRTLVSRPDLAASVKHAQFRGAMRQAVWTKTTAPEYSERERELLDIFIQTAFEHPENWKAGFEHGHLDALIALSLALLPNLQGLSLDFNALAEQWTPEWVYSSDDEQTRLMKTTPPNWHYRYLDQLFKESILGPNTSPGRQLTRLRNVACGGTANRHVFMEYPVMPIDVVLPFFYLTDLQSINISNVVARTIAWPQKMPQLRLPTIWLEGMLESAAAELLVLCRDLKDLTYRFVCDDSRSSDVRLLKPQILVAALEQNKDNIEVFELFIMNWTSMCREIVNQGPWGVEGVTGSLKHFTKLTTLTIPIIALLGWHPKKAALLSEVLPDQLVSIQLHNTMDDSFGWEWKEEDYLKTAAEYIQYVMENELPLQRFTYGIREYQWKPLNEQLFKELGRGYIVCEFKF